MNGLINPKKKILEFINNIIKPTYRNFIVIASFIYLVTQIIAIFFGIKIVMPEQYRDQTIWIAGSLIIISLIYYWIKSKFKIPYEILKHQSEQVLEKLKIQEESLKLLEGLSKIKKPPLIKEVNLTYPDIEFAIYCLIKKIDKSNFFDKDASGKYDPKKNVIIGIDRGGAIVGGMLAKNLGLSITTLAIAYADKPKTVDGTITPILVGCLDDIQFDSVTKILLVDDAIRKGSTMLVAKQTLEQIINSKNKQMVLNIACILYQQQNHPLIKEREVSFCTYKTMWADIWFPWDLYERKLLEKDKINQFEELCNK